MTSKRVQAITNNVTSNFGIIKTIDLVRGIKQILTGSINIERTKRCWRDFIEADEGVKLRSSFFWDVAMEVVVEAVVVVVVVVVVNIMIIITVNICCS
jgi:hypothetical protein